MTQVSSRRVAVLMGGPSAEHDVSMTSGAQVMAALEDLGPLPVVIERDGTWKLGGVAQPSLGAALDALAARADVAVIALHGPFGEDGTVQALLETLGLAYTGSGVAASALAMDKIRTKYVYGARELPTSPFVALGAADLEREGAGLGERLGARFGFPCVVKPSRNGSSFGVSFPRDASALEREVARLVGEGHEVLVERFVRGRELTCGVLERGGRPFALPPTEIIPDARFEFFDYAAKYTPGATREITPAAISPELTAEVQRLAVAAHLALGCRGMSRTDVMLDLSGGGEGRPVLLETNTIPGMTGTSLLPQAAAVVGISLRQLVELMIDDALQRRRGPA
jgi:D-alanine-D-alanine ligase